MTTSPSNENGRREYEPPLDPGIATVVELLRNAGVETFESCQGGEGHSYLEPAVRFHGQQYEGLRALSVAQMHGLPVRELRRVWRIEDGEPNGPWWELTFAPTKGHRRVSSA
jgi:hypothetical protein